MDRTEILRRRLAAQLLTGPGAERALDVVRRLTCVQSQEPTPAFWSLGMRTAGLSLAQVQAEFDAGDFVRTHILRPTWHYVAAEDLGWILAATSARVHQLNASILRRLDITEARAARVARTIVTELTGGHHRTRAEIGRVIGAEGIALAYYVMWAELEYLICSGPLRGRQHTYAVVGERIDTEASGTVADLARRFYAGHGPATVRDLARWASLTQKQAADATEAAADQLHRVTVEATELWSDAAIFELSSREGWVDEPAGPGRAALLPLYDEATLTYPQLTFPRAPEHPHEPGTDLYVGTIVVGTTNLGLWRRTTAGRELRVEFALAPGASAGQRAAIDETARQLGRFWGREVELVDLGVLARV